MPTATPQTKGDSPQVVGRPFLWRLVSWTILAIISAWSLSRFLSSRAEIFWVLVAPLAWLGSHAFGLFPPPRLNAKTRLGRWTAVAVLVMFPIGFYSFLVFATGSPWSWTEVSVNVLFFSIALETVLLYMLQIQEGVKNLLIRRYGPKWNIPAMVITRGVLYAFLFPFLLTILAIHRPKLLPRRLHEISSRNQEQVVFMSQDGRTHLRGVIFKPDAPRGTVLVCHGVGANHADIASIIVLLYDSGYQVLAFDFRGHGASDGHTITYGDAERYDVLAAYEFILRHPEAQQDRLYALGVSMGGATLLETLPEMPQVRAAVIDSAFANLGDMAENQFRFFPRVSRPAMRQIVRVFGWMEVGVDVEAIRPIDTIAKTSIPLLLIHGAEDHVIPTDHSQRLARARPAKTWLHIEPGSPHIGMAILNPTGYSQMVHGHFSTRADYR